MKRNVLLAASIIPLLIFCCNKSQIIPNDAEKEEKSSVWESFEDKVFPTPKEDTAYFYVYRRGQKACCTPNSLTAMKFGVRCTR